MAAMKRTIFTGLAALCLLVVLLPAGAAADRNVVRYLPHGESDPNRAHTIYWTQGITPPVMPGQLLEQGGAASAEEADFVLIDGDGRLTEPKESYGRDYEEFYVTEYLPGNGWYDMKKMLQPSGSTDENMCFAMSEANLIHWWVDQNRENIEAYLELHPEDQRVREVLESNAVGQDPTGDVVYRMMLGAYGLTGEGGYSDIAGDYFFNGYPAVSEGNAHIRNDPDRYRASAGGGVFYPVFGRSILTDSRETQKADVLIRVLRESLLAGHGVVISHNWMGDGKGHAITLWGMEFDENDQLCAAYVVDNNYSPSGEGPEGSRIMQYFTDREGHQKLISMMRYQAAVIPLQHGAEIRLSRYKDPGTRGVKVTGYYLLTTAREGWSHYLENGTPLYPKGRPFLNPPDHAPGRADCRHSYEYTAEGNRIVQTCRSCNLRQWVQLRVDQGPYIYDGSAHEPGKKMVSPEWNAHAFYPDIRYRDHVNAGTATVTMTYRGQTVTGHFEILPAVQDAPSGPPVLLKRGANSVTLQEQPGLEFSRDLDRWQSSGVFQGLEPDTDYRFYVRTAAADTNHAPSLPGAESLPVRTQHGPVQGPPDWSMGEIRVSGGEQRRTVTVLLENTGRSDTVTLLAAGYDRLDRQVSAAVLPEITGTGALPQQLVLRDPAGEVVRVKVFLTRNGSPVTQCGQWPAS